MFILSMIVGLMMTVSIVVSGRCGEKGGGNGDIVGSNDGELLFDPSKQAIATAIDIDIVELREEITISEDNIKVCNNEGKCSKILLQNPITVEGDLSIDETIETYKIIFRGYMESQFKH